MLRIIVGALVVGMFLAAPVPARAADRDILGLILVGAGGGLIAAAFNYEGDQCPPGYTVHTFESDSTLCHRFTSSGSDTKEATVKTTFERPGLLWGGLGAAAAGVVLMLLPEGQEPVVDVSLTPDGWRASKTFQLPW